MKIEKLKLTNVNKYTIRHSKKIVFFLTTLLLFLIAGYFQQSKSFEIMHIFIYNTPIAYILGLLLIALISFCLKSSIVITDEKLFFILSDFFGIKIFNALNLNEVSNVDFNKKLTLFGFNWLKISNTSQKKLFIPIDLYEKKNNLVENLITVINKKTKINLDKDHFNTLLEKKHSLQFKNILILTLLALFLYLGLFLFLNSSPKLKLRINENLLSFSKVFNPNNSEIYTKLGEVYIQQAKYKKASVVLEKAVKLDPNNDLALYYYGISHIYLLKTNKAVEVFSAALKLKPDNLHYMSILAYAYSLKDDKENALKYADIVLKKGSKKDEDYLLISNVYFKYKQLKNGFICLIKARDLSKDKKIKKTKPAKKTSTTKQK